MRILTVSILFFCFLSHPHAQNLPFHSKQLKPITKRELRSHIAVLASDSLEGRFTGSIGQKKAANYIAEAFQKNGLKTFNDSTYFQHFSLWSWEWATCSLSFNNVQLRHTEDFIYRSSSPIDSLLEAPCIFIGHGQDSLINHLDLDGKVAFVYSKNLRNYYRLYYKLKRKGIQALIMANPYDKNAFYDAQQQYAYENSNLKLLKKKPVFSKSTSKLLIVKPQVAEQLFKRSTNELIETNTPEEIQKIPQANVQLHCPVKIEQIVTENVIGFLPGKAQSNETIVLSAHYDHIGKRGEKINYGADDNASGVSALITIAKTYSKAKTQPDKNILFLATSGEELGLLGAHHFASQQANHAYEIKANINIDMIGRRDSLHKKNYIYLIGAAQYPVMDSLCHVANQLDSLKIDYSYNKSRGFGNFLNLSDHYAFHKQGIPILGFFSGLHQDYHKPSDTIDKIEFDEMLKRVRLIYTTSFLAAQKDTFK